jgi:ArsR family transcriptional regulator
MNSASPKWRTPGSSAAADLYEVQAGIARALGHATRLRILDLIGGGEVAFADLARRAAVSKTGLSQHLQVLRAAHVVTVRREGRAAFVALRYPEIEVLCSAMRDALARHIESEGRRTEALRRAARRRDGGRP